MKAIVNGRIVTPAEVLEGKVLLYDRQIAGIVAPEETPAEPVEPEPTAPGDDPDIVIIG